MKRILSARKVSTLEALLAAMLGTANLLAQPVPPPTLERLVFRNDDSLEAIQAKYASELKSKLDAMDHTCQLTPEQKRSLELAGRGDINRFFDQFLGLKEEIAQTGPQPTTPRYRNRVIFFQTIASSSLHHEYSLFGKSIRRILTPEQTVRYDAMVAKDRRAITQDAISTLDMELGQVGDWPTDKRGEFQRLLRTKLKPVWNTGPASFYCLMIQLGQVSKNEYEKLLSASQRSMVDQCIEFARTREPALRQAGYFPPDDGDLAPVKPVAVGVK